VPDYIPFSRKGAITMKTATKGQSKLRPVSWSERSAVMLEWGRIALSAAGLVVSLVLGLWRR
jgi:hypothetical protein